MNNDKFKRLWLISVAAICASCALSAHAAEELSKVVGRIEGNIYTIANLLVIISYVAGVGFALAGVVQFKTHKDNPQQVPLSKPIVYLVVGGFLLFLPQLMGTAGKSIFGEDKSKIEYEFKAPKTGGN